MFSYNGRSTSQTRGKEAGAKDCGENIGEDVFANLTQEDYKIQAESLRRQDGHMIARESFPPEAGRHVQHHLTQSPVCICAYVFSEDTLMAFV